MQETQGAQETSDAGVIAATENNPIQLHELASTTSSMLPKSDDPHDQMIHFSPESLTSSLYGFLEMLDAQAFHIQLQEFLLLVNMDHTIHADWIKRIETLKSTDLGTEWSSTDPEPRYLVAMISNQSCSRGIPHRLHKSNRPRGPKI